MNILDVVLSDEVVFHDTCKAMEEYYPFTQTFRADETLLRLAEEACQAVLEEPFHFHVGRIATGAVSYTHLDVYKRQPKESTPRRLLALTLRSSFSTQMEDLYSLAFWMKKVAGRACKPT